MGLYFIKEVTYEYETDTRGKNNFFSALISFFVLWIGNYITVFFNKFNLGKKATIVAGVMLIVIGLKEVI